MTLFAIVCLSLRGQEGRREGNQKLSYVCDSCQHSDHSPIPPHVNTRDIITPDCRVLSKPGLGWGECPVAFLACADS